MKSITLLWLALICLFSQKIQAREALSFEIKKRLEDAISAQVAVLTTYDPNHEFSAASLIEYEISQEEEKESSGFFRVQIKRVIFKEFGKHQAFLFDSHYSLPDKHVFQAQEALVGVSFMIPTDGRDLFSEGFMHEIYEEALEQIEANSRQMDAMKAVYLDYFSQDLLRDHLSRMLGFPQKNPLKAEVSCKLLPARSSGEETVITGLIDNSATPQLELKSVGLYINGLLAQKSESEVTEDRTFRFSFKLSEATRIHLFVEGVSYPLILYMEPGNLLHAHIKTEKISYPNYNHHYYRINHTVSFVGDLAQENKLLQEYMVNFRSTTNWKHPRHGFNTNLLFKPSYIPEGKTLSDLKEAFQSSGDFISAHGEGLAPAFLDFLKTENRYFYQFQIHGNSPDADLFGLSFPTLEHLYKQNLSYDCSAQSFWFHSFLRAQLKSKMIHANALKSDVHISALDKYHFVSVVFQGYPKYCIQAELLIEAFTENNIRDYILEDLAETFLKSCRDERLTQAVMQMMERKASISQGNAFPHIMLVDQDAEEQALEQWLDAPALVVFSQSFAREEMRLLEEIHTEFPALQLILIEHNHQLNYDKFKTTARRKTNYDADVYIDFDAANSSLPGIKLPPQPFGNQDLEALGVYGIRRYYAFLIDKHGVLQSEWGDYLLDYPEYLRDRVRWTIYKDARDNPWLAAEVLWPLGIALFFIPLFIFMSIRMYKRRISRREAVRRRILERELKGIRAQLNPHFLFNAMGSIQNLVDSAQPEEANRYLSQFSTLMRQVLNHSQQEMIPLSEEISLLNNYLELESLRHGFQWEIDLDPNIDIHNTEVPSMMLQPYVENAILHGIAGMGGEGKILIQIDKLNQQLLVNIEDNGLGIESTLALSSEHVEKGKGLGMKLTQERMEKLGDRYGGDFRILLYDRMHDELPAQGTRVEVWIPIES